MADEPIEVLLERIQRHLDAKAGQAGLATRGASVRPNTPKSFSPQVYERLEEAEAIQDSISVQPFLTPSHIPVIGRLWQKMRWSAHQLVVFYVNRLAGAQGTFNREIVGCLSILVDDLDRGHRAESKPEIASLRAEMQTLRAELAALKASASKSRP